MHTSTHIHIPKMLLLSNTVAQYLLNHTVYVTKHHAHKYNTAVINMHVHGKCAYSPTPWPQYVRTTEKPFAATTF